MLYRITMLYAILILGVALTACDDDYEKMFEVFPTDRLKENSHIPIADIFPGEWEAICVVAPGERPIHTINRFLPTLNADWLADRRIQDYDFPDGLYKIILISSDKFRAIISNKNIAEFEKNECF